MGLFDRLHHHQTTSTHHHHNNNNPPSYPSQPISNSTQDPYHQPTPGDQRPLPPGWQKQWDDRYQRFFYINTRSPNGPQSQWIHPADDPASSNYQQPPYPSSPYAPAPQPVIYSQANPQQAGGASGSRLAGRAGMNPLLAGAGGLAGGMLLGSMLESHHHHHEDYLDGYQQGYENGYENGFETGDGFDGMGFDDAGGGFDFF